MVKKLRKGNIAMKEETRIPRNDEEIRQLKEIIENERGSYTLLNRARILIALMEQKKDAEIADEIGVTTSTVKNVRKAYLEKGYDGIFRKERKKTPPVSYSATFRCQLSTAVSHSVVGIYLDSLEAAFIIQKDFGFSAAGSGVGSVLVRGKDALKTAENLAQDGTLSMQDAVRIAYLNSYKKSSFGSGLYNFYMNFYENTRLPYVQYDFVYFEENKYGSAWTIFSRNVSRNVRCVEMGSKKEWIRELKNAFSALNAEDSSANDRERILDQIQLFFGIHDEDALPFMWLQDKLELYRGAISSEIHAEDSGVAELPDSYTAILGKEELECGKKTGGIIASWAVMISRDKGSYGVRAKKILCPVPLRSRQVYIRTIEDIEKLDLVRVKMLEEWPLALEMKLAELLTESVTQGMGTAFEDKGEETSVFSRGIPLKEIAPKTDGTAVLYESFRLYRVQDQLLYAVIFKKTISISLLSNTSHV